CVANRCVAFLLSRTATSFWALSRRRTLLPTSSLVSRLRVPWKVFHNLPIQVASARVARVVGLVRQEVVTGEAPRPVASVVASCPPGRVVARRCLAACVARWRSVVRVPYADARLLRSQLVA